MLNNSLSIQSGQAELKDNYENESIYEAIRRRRRNRVDRLELEDKDFKEENERIRDQFPKPNF